MSSSLPSLLASEGGWQDFTLKGGEWAILWLSVAAALLAIAEKLRSVVTRLGVERYGEAGEVFDPHRHEAIAQAPVEGAQSGTITEVYQLGYRLGEDVLRPAKVVVAA